jgi:hypothetical protein
MQNNSIPSKKRKSKHVGAVDTRSEITRKKQTIDKEYSKNSKYVN